MNPLTSVDSYKLSHYSQLPPGTQHVYAYGSPRKGDSEIPILGLTKVGRLLSKGLTRSNVEDLRILAKEHGVPFNDAGWFAMLAKYEEGAEFPLVVRGVPEGTVVNPGTPVFSVVNRDEAFPWLTSFFETLILRAVWYPSTVAAISRECKKVIKKAMEETCVNLDGLPFKLHDFGARGVSSGESAALGGMGHLINFQGTDTIEAIVEIRKLYGEPMAGFSIPASEHSTVTSWGPEGEEDMYEAFIKANAGPGKVFACVSDSYNIWKALRKWKALEPLLLSLGGTLVVRPDSQDPVFTPIRVIEELMELFGSTVNIRGYRVLPEHIRVIQGDGINLESLKTLLFHLKQKKISIDNIAFGMGGGLLQQCNRDTYGWAMKTSAVMVDDQWRDVYKDPLGGGKTSLRGMVTARGTLNSSLYSATQAHIATSGFVTYYDCGYVADPLNTWGQIKTRAEV